MSAEIFIATPTAGGRLSAAYTRSVADMVARLHAAGHRTLYRSLDGRDLVRQRDLLADAFLRSQATHLLFVDSDMAFAPDLCERLLACAVRLVGTVYTRRALDLARLRRLLPRAGFDHGLALAYDWNLRPLGDGIALENALCRVGGIGFGFALIERACFTELERASPAPLRPEPGPHGPVRAFFRETDLGDGTILDLDYSFCRRWIEAGGEVWADPDARIRHVGDFPYGAAFGDYLNALGTAPRAAPVERR